MLLLTNNCYNCAKPIFFIITSIQSVIAKEQKHSRALFDNFIIPRHICRIMVKFSKHAILSEYFICIPLCYATA